MIITCNHIRSCELCREYELLPLCYILTSSASTTLGPEAPAENGNLVRGMIVAHSRGLTVTLRRREAKEFALCGSPWFDDPKP